MQKAHRKCANAECTYEMWFDPNSWIPTLTLGYDGPKTFASYLTCENPSPHTYKYSVTIAGDTPVIGDPVA
jgi:hypothetical protein